MTTRQIILAAAVLAGWLSLAHAGPLHDAVIAGDIDQLKALIAVGEEDLEEGARVIGQGQGTPLFHASAKGFAEAVRVLVEAGADVNATKYVGRRPLHPAAEGGRTEVTRILLGAGADPNARERAGVTALQLAANRGHVEIVEMLIDAGADVDAQHEQDGMSPLHFAAAGGHLEITNLLLDAGATVDIGVDASHSAYPLGTAPLGIATVHNRRNVAALLIDRGADVNRPGGQGRTPFDKGNRPLHDAVGHNNADIVVLLVDKGADIDAKNEIGFTALHFASQFDRLEVVMRLMALGADPDGASGVPPASDETPLAIAVRLGHADVADLLLAAGANE